ncbi:sugar transferase, partial [Vibrio anguillarum]|nr:sugar transferase [Vibrio anguillarum]
MNRHQPTQISITVFKRTMDLLGAIVGLILLSPLFPIIAFAIKINSSG